MVWDGQFYILAENQLYTSSNGLNWRKVETEQSIKQLTANMALEAGKKLIGIDMENQYIESEDGMNWNTFENIPEDFPTQNVSFAAYPLATNASLARIVVMGDNQSATNSYTSTWFQLGTEQGWSALNTDADSYNCPNLENISMIHYNNQLYAFGGPDKNDETIGAFSHLYSSIDNGITWEKKTELVMFPQEFTQLYQQAGGNYSWAIDQDNFLWIMWSQTGEVWRGRINKLGFDK